MQGAVERFRGRNRLTAGLTREVDAEQAAAGVRVELDHTAAAKAHVREGDVDALLVDGIGRGSSQVPDSRSCWRSWVSLRSLPLAVPATDERLGASLPVTHSCKSRITAKSLALGSSRRHPPASGGNVMIELLERQK